MTILDENPLPSNASKKNAKDYRFPPLVKRYKALLIDVILLFTVMIITMIMVDDTEYRTPVMVSLGLILVLTYEPVLTVYSATIGQRLMKIRVRDINDPSRPIHLGLAYVRVVVKDLLGWLSFISIHFNAEHRAIHDILGSSIVIDVRDPDKK